MQPPFGAHSRFGAQQPRPGPHQWCPRIAQDCAYASPANDSTNATASVAKIAREIMMSPGSPVGKSCHGDGGRAIEGIGCAEHETARDEGIFSGPSTGANIAAALAVARRLGPGHRVVTIQVDSGLKYLTGQLYS